MAFAATAVALPNNPRGLGGFVDRKWTFTNGALDTGGTIDTGFAYIHKVQIEITSHIGSATPKITSYTSTAPNVTIETGPDVDGNITVTGRGVA